MTSPLHLAVLDDEEDITRLLATYLQGHGFRVSQLHRGPDLLALMARDAPVLVLLDLGLPGEDGFAIARQLREHWQCGLVIVTGRGDAVDKVVGLEVGADDYLSKPFSPRELLARIKSVLRRSKALPPNLWREELRWFRFAGWTLDAVTRNLTAPDGVVVPLSATEFKLLRTLLDHPGQVLTRDQLIELMLSRDADPFDRALDVQVSRLRQRLREDAREPAIIKTVRGQGYVLAAVVENEPR